MYPMAPIIILMVSLERAFPYDSNEILYAQVMLDIGAVGL